MTEFEEFILALDASIKDGARAEQALRSYVLKHAELIRNRKSTDKRNALIVGIITIILTLITLSVVDHEAKSKVQVDCMDPTERERIRDIVIKGIDSGLQNQIQLLFEVWMKDLADQPRRAMVGTNNAVNAHVRARKQAVSWDPPHCE